MSKNILKLIDIARSNKLTVTIDFHNDTVSIKENFPKALGTHELKAMKEIGFSLCETPKELSLQEVERLIESGFAIKNVYQPVVYSKKGASL